MIELCLSYVALHTHIQTYYTSHHCLSVRPVPARVAQIVSVSVLHCEACHIFNVCQKKKNPHTQFALSIILCQRRSIM
jgi:hypothetical protein